MVEYIRAVDCLFFHADGTEIRTATVVVGDNPIQAFAGHSDGGGLKVSALVAIQRDSAREGASSPNPQRRTIDPEPRQSTRHLNNPSSGEGSYPDLGAWSALTGEV